MRVMTETIGSAVKIYSNDAGTQFYVVPIGCSIKSDDPTFPSFLAANDVRLEMLDDIAKQLSDMSTDSMMKRR